MFLDVVIFEQKTKSFKPVQEKRMRLSVVFVVTVFVVSLLEEEGVSSIPFSAVTPNLSTGWFHKPGPTESLLFGLVVLKVLALRMAGVVPYNLNELLAEGKYIDKNLKAWGRKKSSSKEKLSFSEKSSSKEKSSLSEKSSSNETSSSTVEPSSIVETSDEKSAPKIRTLREISMKRNGFNRMEKYDAEIHILERILLGLRRIDSHDCFMRHLCDLNQKKILKETSTYEEHVLKIFTLGRKDKGSVWELFKEALHPSPANCQKKFSLCPLATEDFSLSNIINGIF